jgi:hypothetical protein
MEDKKITDQVHLYSMDTAWILHGYCMDTAWILHRYSLVSPYIKQKREIKPKSDTPFLK